MNKTILCLALFFAVSIAQQQCYNDVNNADCVSCANTAGCGFCGVTGSGSCVPGDAQGSQLAQYNISECPSNFWKFGASECSDPVRIVSSNVTVNETTGETIKVKWDSLSVAGGSKVTYDALEFSMETQGDDGGRHIAFAVTYASGSLGDRRANATIFGVVFDNIFEFVDKNDDGLDFDDIVGDTGAYTTPIDSFLPFTHMVRKFDSVDVFIGNVTTADGKLTVVCYIGAGTWTYTHPIYANDTMQMDPYQMKCDLLINDWEYKNHTDQAKKPTLGVQGFVASATVDVSLNTTDSNNDNHAIDGEVSFGGGIGFFRWAKTVTALDADNKWGEYDVIVTDIPLPNNNNTWVPPGTAIKTTIFSINNDNQVLSRMIWDPKVGIDPVASNTNDNSATSSSPSPSSSTSSSTSSTAKVSNTENASSTIVASFFLLAVTLLF